MKKHKTPDAEIGLKPKDLVGIPWRVAFALQADGWWLRSDIIWAKPNPMPESVTDRPTKAHEYIFLLAKSGRYYYDRMAIAEPAEYAEQHANKTTSWGTNRKHPNKANVANYAHKGDNHTTLPGGNRNRRTVWTIATVPFSGSHFAVFPPALVEPCIKAGTSEKGCCPICGSPWERVVDLRRTFESGSGRAGNIPVGKHGTCQGGGETLDIRRGPVVHSTTTGWQPTCTCGRTDTVPATVLDPFLGSGTTLLVAQRLGRNGVGIELNAEYCELAQKRLTAEHQQGRFAFGREVEA